MGCWRWQFTCDPTRRSPIRFQAAHTRTGLRVWECISCTNYGGRNTDVKSSSTTNAFVKADGKTFSMTRSCVEAVYVHISHGAHCSTVTTNSNLNTCALLASETDCSSMLAFSIVRPSFKAIWTRLHNARLLLLRADFSGRIHQFLSCSRHRESFRHGDKYFSKGSIEKDDE